MATSGRPAGRTPGAHRADGRVRLGRALVVVGALLAVAIAALLIQRGASGALAWRETAATARAPGALLGALCTEAAGLLLAWLSLAALLAALATWPGRLGRHAGQLSAYLVPAVLRSAVAAALGGTLAFGSVTATIAAVTAPASAPARPASPSARPASAPVGPVSSPVTSAPEPARPPADPGLVTTRTTPARSAAGRPDGSADGDLEEVVVRRADTLWSIAARHLGPGASAAEIAREWPRWFAANHAVIGDDPDLLRPGQLLVAPR